MIRGDQRQQQLQQRQGSALQYGSQSSQIYSISSPDRQQLQPKVLNYASPPQIQSISATNAANYQSYHYQTLQPNTSQQFLKNITSPQTNTLQPITQQLSDSYKYQGTKVKNVLSVDSKIEPERKSNTSQKEILYSCQKENQNYRTQTLTDIRNLTFNPQQDNQKSQQQNNSNNQVYNIQHLLQANKSSFSSYDDIKTKPQLLSQPISEMTKISSNLRDLLQSVQRHSKDGKLSDSLNEKILDLLTSFRKVEEQHNHTNQNSNNTNLTSELTNFQNKCGDYEKRLSAKEEDYQKLKGIMDSLQAKMTILVQENQKINKNLIDYDNKVLLVNQQNRQLEDKNMKLEIECSRILKCLEINQREIEESKMYNGQNDSIRRQLFDDSNKYKILEFEQERSQIQSQLQEKSKMIEQLQLQLWEKSEVSIRSEKQFENLKSTKEFAASRTTNNNIKFEQLELKVISLQIENENLTSEMAHLLIDNKAMEQKNEMIAKLEEIIKNLLNDKSDLELAKDNTNQLCSQQQVEIQSLRIQYKELSHHYEGILEKTEKIPIMDRKISYLEETIQTQEKSCIEMEKTLKEKQIFIKSMEKELLMAGTKIGQLEDMMKKERSDQERVKQIFSEDKNNLMSEYKKQIEKMDLHINDKNEVIDKSQKEINKFKDEIRKSQERYFAIERYVEQLNNSLLQQTALQQSLVNQIEVLKQSEITLKQEFERSEISMKSQIESQSDEIQSQQFESRQRVQDLKDELSGLAKKIEIRQREFDASNQKIQELNVQIAKLVDQVEFQKKVFGQSNEELQRRIKQEQQKNQESHLELKSHIQNVERLSRELNQQRQVQLDLEDKSEMFVHQIEQKNEQYELVRGELDRTRSANFNLQEELLRAGMLMTQLQSSNQGLKNDVSIARNEQENLIELLKKRKEEVILLHQNIDYFKKETLKSKDSEDSRKSLIKNQDGSAEQIRRENQELKVILANMKNDLQKKCKELEVKDQEVQTLRHQYDQTYLSLLDNDRKWGQ